MPSKIRALAAHRQYDEGSFDLSGISIDDIVGLYLKEMARVPLLSTEQEVDLAKRIERGWKAETQTEKMIVPVVVMILGLVLFIAFGAVSAITDNGASTFRPAATQPHTTTGK